MKYIEDPSSCIPPVTQATQETEKSTTDRKFIIYLRLRVIFPSFLETEQPKETPSSQSLSHAQPGPLNSHAPYGGGWPHPHHPAYPGPHGMHPHGVSGPHDFHHPHMMKPMFPMGPRMPPYGYPWRNFLHYDQLS